MLKFALLRTVRLFGISRQANITQFKFFSSTIGKHRSDAEKRISEIPVIMCEDNVVVCDGGDGALGHPIEYIRLDTVSDKPQSCPYCGLRYQLAPKKNRYGHVMHLH